MISAFFATWLTLCIFILLPFFGMWYRRNFVLEFHHFFSSLVCFLSSYCPFPLSFSFHSCMLWFFYSCLAALFPVSPNTYSTIPLSSFITLSSVFPRCHDYSCEVIIASRKSTVDTEGVFRAHTRQGAIVFRQLLVPLLLALHQTMELNGESDWGRARWL